MPFSRWDELETDNGPLVLVHAQGSTVYDSDGKSYIDGVGALEAMILGAGRAEITLAIERQLARLPFLDLFRYASVPAIELAERLAALAPGSLSRVHFTPGGSEANEAAIKIALQYFLLRGEPARRKLITRSGAFHGVTFGAMSLDGNYFNTSNHIYGNVMPQSRIAAPPACEACHLGKVTRHLACPHRIEEIILAERPETVAAVVVDPAATSIAVSVPPPSYLIELRAICDRYGILLIADEVITGVGRTGRMFGCEHSAVVPDMILLSKGLTSGYAPLGAVVVPDQIAATFTGGPEGRLNHGQTYGGHPAACAAALETLRLVQAEDLVNRAAETGEYLLKGLRSLSSHPSYWDARGSGLIAGLELVEDRSTGAIFKEPSAFGKKLRDRCRSKGALVQPIHPGNVLFLAPPLVITRAEVDALIDAIDKALAEVEAELELN